MALRSSCSQCAHDETVLAWDKSASRRARGWAGENIARSQRALQATLLGGVRKKEKAR